MANDRLFLIGVNSLAQRLTPAHVPLNQEPPQQVRLLADLWAYWVWSLAQSVTNYLAVPDLNRETWSITHNAAQTQVRWSRRDQSVQVSATEEACWQQILVDINEPVVDEGVYTRMVCALRWQFVNGQISASVDCFDESKMTAELWQVLQSLLEVLPEELPLALLRWGTSDISQHPICARLLKLRVLA